MQILHRYILKLLVRNLCLALAVFTLLFLVFDFFDRFDNILPEDVAFGTVVKYFLLKIPLTLNLMLPIAMLVTTLLTIGILSKNSEITAMRASGVTILWIARPLFALGLFVSLFSIFLSETVIPYSSRRVREIYNIDIKQKHKMGAYSQSDFWWRSGNTFYSVDMFDSRNNTLLNLSKFELSKDFQMQKRVDARKASWVLPSFGWTMEDVTQYRFDPEKPPDMQKFKTLPLPIGDKPEDFYERRADPHAMSYFQLKKYMKRLQSTGVPTGGLRADLHEKLAFPFINLIAAIVVLPFALRPARSGKGAISFVAGLVIGFTYYAIHSFSLALGRAELTSPILAAWTANILMGFVGFVLNLGAEAP